MKNIPITIIGGYLGAGKTTLINKILTSDAPLSKLAVLVNDFGNINLDARWIKDKSPNGRVFGLTNGCVCCTIGDDLSEALEMLREQLGEFPIEHVLLEASGVASPQKLQRQCSYPGYYPRATFVLVDAVNHNKQCQDKFVGYLAKQQVDEADYLIASKLDLAPNFTLHDGYKDKVVHEPNIFSPAYDQHGVSEATVSADFHSHGFASCVLPQTAEVTIDNLKALCDALPSTVHRVKGYVKTEQGLHLLQRVSEALTLEKVDQETVTPSEQPKLVFIYIDQQKAAVQQHLQQRWQDWRLN
tara:strand:- start:68 stop:967 length:900 start_codon:yes stop_codon:yes gene_type:complete